MNRVTTPRLGTRLFRGDGRTEKKRPRPQVLVALANEVLLALTVVLMMNAWPSVVDEATPETLPSLGLAAVQLLACLPLSEALFYFGHRALHQPFMYDHVHYVHHQFDAPFALASIYAHPVEFILANIPTILGPMLVVRPHVACWAAWSAGASLKIIQGHVGWHLPFIHSPEAHDFHHSLDHGRNLNNLGQLGILDALFGTNKDWLDAWQLPLDKTYATPDYPVDRVLARDAAAARAEDTKFAGLA